MNGLATVLDPEFAPTVQEASEGILSFSQFAVYRDCRFHVVGTTTKGPVPLTLLRETTDKAREAITLCVLPRTDLELVTLRTPTALDVKTGVFAFYRSDIEALASGEVTIEQLLEYKLFRRLIAERPDKETQFIERLFVEYGCRRNGSAWLNDLDDAVKARGETENEWVEHPLLTQVESTIERRRHCLLFGYSSSGKSVLAFQVGRRREAAGWQVGYVNLSDNMPWPAGLVQDFLFGDSSEARKRGGDAAPRLVIGDDLQSRPPVARLLLGVASLAQRVRERSRPILLGVSWKEFAREAAQFCPDAAPIPIHAKLVRDQLLEKYAKQIDQKAVDAIAAEAGDDLYLLRLALGVTARQKSTATKADVAEDIWKKRVRGDGRHLLPAAESRRVALLTAAIGQFDIHVPLDFLQQTARVEPRLLTQLMESRLLRRVGDRATLGHRSLCALIVWWLDESGAWRELQEVGGPHDITSAVLAYLKASGTPATVDALRALVARAGFKNREDLSNRAQVLMDVWRVFDAVVERVEQQQAADPTWGNTPSSAVFVTTLLGEIGKPELATPSLEFLRSHWQNADGRLQIDTAGLSTVVDFDIIKQRMLDEDAGAAPGKEIESALTIDIKRFHKTWLAGLILGAESVTDAPKISRDKLAALVELEQIKTSGAFYPHRVPWCTARVVLGLASCGRSVENSEVVKRAIDWLLRERSAGGACENGYWRSGTGDWNSSVEPTALVILAAINAGIDPSDQRLTQGREYLLSERERWAGLDGAIAVEALLRSGSKWQDLATDTARLSQRALDQSLWLQATLGADQTLKQTCLVAQAATHLIDIGWTAIRSDLGGLLEALDLSAGSSALVSTNPLSDASSADVEANSITENERTPAIADAVGQLVAELDELNLSRFSVVGSYLRFREQVRNDLRNRYAAIRQAVEKKSLQRENYLIWGASGSGKTSFVTEIANAMGSDFAAKRFCRLDLSELSEDCMVTELNKVDLKGKQPVLCMIDEIESRSSEAWPYERIFTCLDWNMRDDRHIVFVLAGSGGKGLNGMIGTIRDRSRGPDLIDRIPQANRFEIPGSDDEDRLVIFAKQALLAAAARNQTLREIERLVLYFVLKSERLSTPRQLTEFAKAAVARMAPADPRLLYDHLFRHGDLERMEFWVRHQDYATRLQASFLWVLE